MLAAFLAVVIGGGIRGLARAIFGRPILVKRAGHPRRHRYAARRSFAGLRLHGRTGAGSGCLRARGRRVRPGLRACAADAAFPRVDVHRPPALRAQGSRQPRVHVERRHSHAGVDVQGRGLRDWRLRFGVCAASRDWYRAGIRRVRREVSGDGRRSVGSTGPEVRPADARGCRGLVEGTHVGPVLSFPSPLRAAHAVSRAGTLRGSCRLRRRGRVCRRDRRQPIHAP